MSTAIVRSGLRAALRGGAPRSAPVPKRSFSSAASEEEELREINKWRNITIAAAAGCTIFGIYVLSKPHPHFEEPPPYEYLHIRTKEFPWGPNGLFERKDH